MKHTSSVFLVGIMAVVAALAAASAGENAGFVSLFNGKDLKGWKTFVGGGQDAAMTFYVKDGVIVISGNPAGYIYTDNSYKNYVLRFDWRYKRPAGLQDDEQFTGNSGLLMHIQPPQKIWPKSIEVQGMNKQHGRLLTVSGAKALNKFIFHADALKKARKPVGQWNTTEVLSQDGTITAKVNGAAISSGKAEPTEGPFGFQSEGAELYLKNIKIKVLE